MNESIPMELKSWTHFFQAIKAGKKTHDLRSKKDREFKVGQHLLLREYDQFAGAYTGDTCEVVVTFITDDVTPCAFSSAVLEKGYAILSIQRVELVGTEVEQRRSTYQQALASALNDLKQNLDKQGIK